MIGHKFNSGAVCIAIAPGDMMDDYIVLTHWQNEFVVAHISPQQVIEYHREGPTGGSWSNGHYHDNLPDALDTFVNMTMIVTHREVLRRSILRVMQQLNLPQPTPAGK